MLREHFIVTLVQLVSVDILGKVTTGLSILLVLTLFFGIVFIYLQRARIAILEALPHSWSDYVYRHLLIRPLKSRYQTALNNASAFYRSLSPRDRKSFEKRVQRFIDSKEFISRTKSQPQVSDSQKAAIAATVIQLTYGHPRIYLSHFSKILVYPDSYYSTITKMRHQGEVNVRGFIVLSWFDFQRGALDPGDGVNLGFHEMAHALQLENLIENDEFGFLDSGALMRLRELQSEIRLRTEKGLFRPRAFENKFEFFAVAVEGFFERSRDFKIAHPEIYELLCQILRQDPIALEAETNRNASPRL